MTPSWIWTEEQKLILLACETDEQLQGSFPEHNLETLKRRQREFRGTNKPLNDTRLGKLAALLEKSGIPIDEVANIDRVVVKEWQAMSKDDNTQEVIVTDLEGASIVLTPIWASGPKWDPVYPAHPVQIHYRSGKPVHSQTKTALITPDIQFGYRRDKYTGKLDGFHDERALDVMLQIAGDFPQIDLAVNLGDGLDNAEFGRFVQEPAFAGVTGNSIQALTNFLAEVSGLTPHAKRVFMEGNHDRRIENYILKNAMAAYGISRAKLPDSWMKPREGEEHPVFTVPFLCRMEEIGWEYQGGYPANSYYVNDRLAAVHGEKVRSSGSTAAAVIDDERVSVMFGHVHRIEKQHKTMRVMAKQGTDPWRTNFAASIGCLCKIDGTVPSTKGSTDPWGRPIQRAENWQQGFAVVTYEEGDGAFDMEQIAIHNGTAFFRGNKYKSSL